MSRLNKREFTLYALLCDDEAIYVGTCEKNRFEKRFLEHTAGKGSQFTSAYKYGSIQKI
jgi:predicted GIY-YIG superfamily endonuclease